MVRGKKDEGPETPGRVPTDLSLRGVQGCGARPGIASWASPVATTPGTSTTSPGSTTPTTPVSSPWC